MCVRLHYHYTISKDLCIYIKNLHNTVERMFDILINNVLGGLNKWSSCVSYLSYKLKKQEKYTIQYTTWKIQCIFFLSFLICPLTLITYGIPTLTWCQSLYIFSNFFLITSIEFFKDTWNENCKNFN